MALQVIVGPWLLFRSLFYTQSVGLLGRVTGPKQCRYLHTVQHKLNKHTHTSMPRVGFQTTTPAFERAKTVHGLDRRAIATGTHNPLETKSLHGVVLQEAELSRTTILADTMRLLSPYMSTKHRRCTLWHYQKQQTRIINTTFSTAVVWRVLSLRAAVPNLWSGGQTESTWPQSTRPALFSSSVGYSMTTQRQTVLSAVCRYNPGICVKALQNSRSTSRDSNRAPPEYKARRVTVGQTCSVIGVLFDAKISKASLKHHT
jgi:hypothetical protein